MRLVSAVVAVAMAVVAVLSSVSAFTTTPHHDVKNLNYLLVRSQKQKSTTICANDASSGRPTEYGVVASHHTAAAAARLLRRRDRQKITTAPTNARKNLELSLSSSSDDNTNNGFFDGFELSLPYALTWVGFIAFAYYMTSTEAPGASQQVLEKFLADPINPGVNELFATVFNLLGLVGVPMACLLMPAAKEQKLPAWPFLASSFFAGYGGLGLYLSVKRKPVTSISKNDLDWVTANVLENKFFNWIFVAITLSTFVATGFISEVLTNDPQNNQIEGYIDLFQKTAIVSTSSCDLAILTLTAASLIPEDLKRRGVDDSTRANLIAASTILLPVVGSTLYCALRPSLPEE